MQSTRTNPHTQTLEILDVSQCSSRIQLALLGSHIDLPAQFFPNAFQIESPKARFWPPWPWPTARAKLRKTNWQLDGYDVPAVTQNEREVLYQIGQRGEKGKPALRIGTVEVGMGIPNTCNRMDPSEITS
jgi:hypothetical protein